MTIFEDSVLRVLKGDLIIGAAFLVSERLVATCAHVVKAAGVKVGEKISLCTSDGKEIEAIVEPEFWRDRNVEDVSILRLNEHLENIQPISLGSSLSTKGHKFSTFGFPKIGQELSGGGEIVGQAAIDGTKVLQLRSTEVTPGFSGAPVFDEITKRVVGIIVAITPPDEYQRLGTTAFAIPSETVREICRELQISDICPYRSLDVFNEEDEPFFFGRQLVVQKMIESLKREPRFLAVLGPSGSGKSSVVRAGLIPALRQGKVPSSQKWDIVTIRPADDPFEQMTGVGFINPQAGLEIAVKTWLAHRPDKTRLVLFIDQFEEVLVSTPKVIQHEFIVNLSKLLDSSLAITVVLTLRDDFYSRLILSANTLAGWLERGLVNIPLTLERDQLLAMIMEPANLAGLAFEDGLVDVMIDDACEADRSNGIAYSTILPLLEFSLMQLWELRQDEHLTHKAYKLIGKITGSLSQWADQAYNTLSVAHQSIARNVLTRLVRLENAGVNAVTATRKRLTIQELGEDPAILTIVRPFVDRHLVASVFDGKNIYVEYIHDSVVHEWKLLNLFLREDQNFITWRQALQDAVLVWYSHQCDQSDLFRGIRLAESERWFSEPGNFLTAKEREFLQESIALRNQEMEKSAQIRQVEQYAQQKMDEEAEIRRRMADPQEREASTWKMALAKHQDDFHQHGTLLNPDTLALLEMQLNNPKLVLEQSDYHLILYSATSCNRGHEWLALLGEDWLEFIRETCLSDECAQPIRLGTAALLGEKDDQSTLENLCLALERAKNKAQELILIDLLAQFLANSSKHWTLKQKGNWAVFRRTAHLRIEACKLERIRMRKIAIVLALASMLISFPTIIIAAQQLEAQQAVAPYLDQNEVNINYIIWGSILISIVFAIISVTTAYFFAEGLTRIDFSIQTWKRPWRMPLLGGFGSLAGILLFFGISGQISMWFAGGLIGLALAFLHPVVHKHPEALRIIIALATSALAIVIGVMLMPATVSWLQKTGTVLSAGCFSGLYVYFASGLRPATLGSRKQ